MTYPMYTTCSNVEVPAHPGLPDLDSLLGNVDKILFTGVS